MLHINERGLDGRLGAYADGEGWDGRHPEAAETLLREDLAWAEAAVRRMVTVPLNRNQFSALVSWVFDIGESAALGSTLIRSGAKPDRGGGAAGRGGRDRGARATEAINVRIRTTKEVTREVDRVSEGGAAERLRERWSRDR